MKSYLLFVLVCFFSFCSQADPNKEPSVVFPKQVLKQVAGIGSTQKYKGVFTCKDLLTKTWAYPSAQVTSFCYDAETSCMRYDLIQQMRTSKTSPQNENLQIPGNVQGNLAFAHDDAQVKLEGCVLAIQATMTGSNLVLPPTGSYAPLINLTHPSSGK